MAALLVRRSSGTRTQCLTRTTSTGSVREWGAQCDTTNPGAPGTISAGQSTFTIPNNNAPRVGQAIAIAGAGSSGATLFAQVGGMITPNTVPSLAASTTSGLNTVTAQHPQHYNFRGHGYCTDVTTPSTNSIPAGAIITHITSSRTIFTMSLPALATKTPSLTFKGNDLSPYQYGSPTTLADCFHIRSNMDWIQYPPAMEASLLPVRVTASARIC